ncbi:carbon catabolite repressor protein 4 homolog 6 [Prunus yedoensis var. nudiflora]|uniref:Carbon catabolite repressor protein 4 homolog 6 n=1 Tax=Prunus yedoensis var. nudiflora TaxID=2094558 RepID=A0A314YEE7_PRUYE|nr:carbon catabolite repressor protein 4 homolog 6 [Prunus yedoensis var. nudiflora]
MSSRPPYRGGRNQWPRASSSNRPYSGGRGPYVTGDSHIRLVRDANLGFRRGDAGTGPSQPNRLSSASAAAAFSAQPSLLLNLGRSIQTNRTGRTSNSNPMLHAQSLLQGHKTRNRTSVSRAKNSAFLIRFSIQGGGEATPSLDGDIFSAVFTCLKSRPFDPNQPYATCSE